MSHRTNMPPIIDNFLETAFGVFIDSRRVVDKGICSFAFTAVLAGRSGFAHTSRPTLSGNICAILVEVLINFIFAALTSSIEIDGFPSIDVHDGTGPSITPNKFANLHTSHTLSPPSACLLHRASNQIPCNGFGINKRPVQFISHVLAWFTSHPHPISDPFKSAPPKIQFKCRH